MTGLNEDKHLIGDVSKMCNVPIIVIDITVQMICII